MKRPIILKFSRSTLSASSSPSSMALRKLLSKRLSDTYRLASPAVTLQNSPISCPPNLQVTQLLNAAKTDYLSSPELSEKGFSRRFLHRKSVNQLPEFLSIPVGEKLREKLKGINITGERLRLDGLVPPRQETVGKDPNRFEITIIGARKILKLSQLERLRAKFREMPNSSISYSEFVQMCVEECGDENQGIEFAKALDRSGNVIVLGNIVFLRPEQMAKSMENLISQSISTPNDPRRKELEQMEQQKAVIDQKARAQVQGHPLSRLLKATSREGSRPSRRN
uniref:Calcium uniporter protein C-terminal domain-containing protein n=1 Tax=Manihot esculenta TaxID=3983 RepID=A0A2C9VZ30_MANES